MHIFVRHEFANLISFRRFAQYIVTEYSDRFGAMLLMLLLSLALSDQIREIHSEKNLAQTEALHLKDELNGVATGQNRFRKPGSGSIYDELNRANTEIQLLNQVMQSAAQLGKKACVNRIDRYQQSYRTIDAEYTANRVATVSSHSQQADQRIHEVSEATEQVAANIHEISHAVVQVAQKITQGA